MQKKHLLALAIAAAFSCSSVNANEYQAQLIKVDQQNAIKDNYIIVFNTPSVLNLNDELSITSFVNQQSITIENNYDVKVIKNFGNTINGVLVKANAEQIAAMQSNPDIKYIEQDQILSIDPIVNTLGDQSNPTWGIDRVDQRDLGLSNSYHYDYDGTGVTAYVIDTGVLNTHNEFGNRASSGYDFVDNDNDATDCNGHGTHVAGTIGGSTYGVAKNVDIVGVRVLSCSGSGTTSGVVSGIDWVKNNASGPSVANMSLGGGASTTLDNAVNEAVAAGISFVVAAGNDDSDACNYSPARAADAITVGSTTSSDARSSFSNYGSCLDIYAPGSSIKSAWYSSNSATNTISGTSMAAPHVAGVVALYLDEDPSLSTSAMTNLLSSRSSKNKISDAISSSPNELVYSLSGGDTPDPDPDPDPNPGCGTDCIEETNLSGSWLSTAYYQIDVPANSQLTVEISGGSGDADLYVRAGSNPTTSRYDCRPYVSGNNESCEFNVTSATTYYIMIRGYRSYSGLSLTAGF
ncbi:S8 family peptidase [uncultured Shewanella sp.]|uniref:S8 family peptidase n=1 Tax=uncultured Shewanella sp. TaxID=173975 RepID=UPI00261A7F4F|nr:S8 family peptidase [uncultured Shewanella sp.]